MKKKYKRLLSYLLILTFLVGYLPAGSGTVAKAEESNQATAKETLQFGNSDTYLQLEKPLSASSNVVEATVNMPEKQTAWTIVKATDINVSNATVTYDKVKVRADGSPMIGADYANINLSSGTELKFSKKFDNVQIPYIYDKDDVTLSFKVYSNSEVAINNGYIELTSSGTYDHHEICYKFADNNKTLQTGWNLVELSLKDMINGSENETAFDLQNVNYLRWHSTKFDSDVELQITDMKLVTEKENDVDESLLIAASEYKSGKANQVFEVKEATVNGETFHYVEQETFLNNSTYRTDISNKELFSLDYTGKNKDNLAVVFWMKSSAEKKIALDTKHFLSLGNGEYATGPSATFNSAITIQLQENTWSKVVLPLKAAKVSGSWTIEQGITWMRLFLNDQDLGVTYSVSDMRIVDMVEEGILADASNYSFADGKYLPELNDKCDEETFGYKEETAYNKTTTQTYNTYRVDFNHNMPFPIDLTEKDASDYALEFWMRSSQGLDNVSVALHLSKDNATLFADTPKITVESNKWTKITLNLKDIYSADNLSKMTTFMKVRLLLQGLNEGSKIAVSDMKLVKVEDNVMATAEKHYSNNGNKMENDVFVTTLPNGQSLNYRTYVTNNKSEIDIANKNVLKNFHNVDLDKYVVTFWMQASVDKNITLNSETKALMFVQGENVFTINIGSVQLKAKEWTKVTLKLSDNTIQGENQVIWDYVRLVIRGLETDESYDISDMYLEYVDTMAESDYTSGKNYMVFSNLDDSATRNQSALMVTEDGYPAVVWKGKQYTVQKNICTGQDVTLKVIRDSKGYLNLYVNDSLVGVSESTTTAMSTPTTAHCIGADAKGNGVMNGSISDVKVYSDVAMQNCIGSWALKGNIENVTGKMVDTSSTQNAAVFKGSRADDWSDYTIPTEVSDVVGTVVPENKWVGASGCTVEHGNVASVDGEKLQYVNAKVGTWNSKNTIYLDAKNLDKIDWSAYEMQNLAFEFWMKSSETVSIKPTALRMVNGSDTTAYGKPIFQYESTAISLEAGKWTKLSLKLSDGLNDQYTGEQAVTWMRILLADFQSEDATVAISDVKLVKIGSEAPYSLVYVPDICNLTTSDNAETWNTMAQWIADNVEAANIQHVVMSGNNTKDNSETSYNYAKDGIQKFSNKVSWSTTVGYYDAEYAGNNTSRNTSEYSQFVNETLIKDSAAKNTYGGCYVDSENEKHTENAYYRFDVNGVKWMILQLEYKPSDNVISWAEGILKEYPLDNVILSTPEFINGYKYETAGNNLKNLTKNTNVKLVLCSHADNGTGAVVQSEANNVPVLMMNAAGLDAGDNAYYTDRALGMIGILRFSADGKNVALQYYSPSEGKSFTPDDPWGDKASNSVHLTVTPQVCTPVVQQYTNATAGTAPTENVPDGYVFAGWFTDEACTEALAKGQVNATAYAKFVDAEMLTVKAQVKLSDDGKNLPTDKTDIRFVTSLDSLQYSKIGLKVSVANKTFETTDYTSVYKKLSYIDKIGDETQSMEITPYDAFSPCSVYFKALTVQNVPIAHYDSEFSVIPYWVTLDGTSVEGKTATKKISDGAVASGETNPQVMTTANATDDIVVADIVPTTMGYAVDNTGVMDSTAGIQTALYDCYNAGGGTVFLPAGTYKISEEIHIPSYVTLRGDYDDADNTTDVTEGAKKKISGTVLSICVESKDSDDTGTIQLSGSSGVVGVTVYYPEQTSLEEVKPYPYTFFVPTHVQGTRAVTLRDITILNGYRGVGTLKARNHESLNVDNVKGTFLHTGFSLRNQSDVGMVNDVTVSSKYWLTTELSGLPSVDEATLQTYMKEHTVGIQAEGLEWTQFQNIVIDGCETGLRFDKGERLLEGWTNYSDSGLLAVSMVNVQVTDCTNGLYISEQGMDSRWGSVITNSKIEGSITNLSDGTLKLTDVTVDKDALTESNKVKVYNDTIEVDIGKARSYQPKKSSLFLAELPKGTAQDVSESLQSVLNTAGKAGGGIVYVPGGTYRLDKELEVPEGVELRGASSVPNREQWIQNGGTVFLCYYGVGENVNPETDDAFITLGEGAGLNGIRILYPENGADKENFTTTYTVKARAKDVYVVNCCIVASGYGIDFRECDNHLIKGLYTGCWYRTFCLGGKGGYLTNCLHNGTVVERTHADGLPDVWGDEASPKGSVGNILKEISYYIRLENATNQKITAVAACSAKQMIESVDSTETVAVNVATDKMKADQESYQFSIDDGDMTVINAMRHQGVSFKEPTGSGTLKLYGRIAIGNVNETSKSE